MSDRTNRIIMILFASFLIVGGCLTVVYGSGGFGHHRASMPIIDAPTVHQWERFGAKSFAVTGLLGFIIFVVGSVLSVREWRRNSGKVRTTDFSFDVPSSTRGQTTVHAPSLSHTLERDLETIVNVKAALVGLFGSAPAIELRGLLTVDDRTELETLISQVNLAIDRFTNTVGFRPHPVQVTIRYNGTTARLRQLQ
jgi:hypothetical protein